VAAQGAGAAEEVREPEYNPRRVFIKLSDLELHGFTAGCRRCNLMRNSLPALGVKHLDACRLRVEQAMRDADHPRLQRAEDRQLGELERRAAARDEEAAPVPPLLAPEAPATPQAWHDEAPRTPPRAAPAWHAVEQPDADGAFDSRLDANGDMVMQVGRAKGQKQVRFRDQTGAASASSLPSSLTRAKGRLHMLDTQLSEQTLLPSGRLPMLDTQLSEQTLLPTGRLGTQTFAVRSARVVELYSPPRVTAILAGANCVNKFDAKQVLAGANCVNKFDLPNRGLVAGSTFDLRADTNGETWDFEKPQDRKRAWERIRAEEPYLVMGSPPCTMFSSLQNLSAKKGTAEWEKRRRAARRAGTTRRSQSCGRHQAWAPWSHTNAPSACTPACRVAAGPRRRSPRAS
jgi:hypothetical protein